MIESVIDALKPAKRRAFLGATSHHRATRSEGGTS